MGASASELGGLLGGDSVWRVDTPSSSSAKAQMAGLISPVATIKDSASDCFCFFIIFCL
jgi:hypothetical protein